MPEPMSVIQQPYCPTLRHAGSKSDLVSQQSPAHVSTITNQAFRYSKSDLVELGFDEKMVLQFIQDPHCVKRAMVMLSSFTPSSCKGRKTRYQHLSLRQGAHYQGWVLFDPANDVPQLQHDMLPLVIKYAVYVPGNAKLLEYNIRNRSIRVRAAQEVLKGKTILYTQNGPIFQAIKDENILEPLPDQPKKARISKTFVKTEDDSDSDLTELESEEDKRNEGT